MTNGTNLQFHSDCNNYFESLREKGETDFVMLFPSLRTQRNLMVELTKKLTDRNHKTMIFSNSQYDF